MLPLLDQASKELWARFTPKGKVDVEGDVKCRVGSSGSPRTDFSLRIGLHDVSLVSGVKGEEILGSASLLGFREGSLSRFEGDVQLRSLKILGQRLRDVEGMFLKEGNLFALHNLSGKIYGGTFEGTARVRLSEPILFGGEATITEMQLEPLAREAFGYENPNVEGKISGRISLQGRGTDPANLVARGELEVRDAKLWELPVVLSMLNLLNLSLPERTAFREASLKYSILNEEALIEEIALKGRAISIYGHGTMGPAGRLDFNFVTGVGPSFLYVPILSDLAREFQHQVAELSVVGTFVRPETRLEARGPLSWPLQALSNIFSKHPSKVPEKENIQ